MTVSGKSGTSVSGGSSVSRRRFLAVTSAVGASALGTGLAAYAAPSISGHGLPHPSVLSAPRRTVSLKADDETAWAEIARDYDVTDEITNLENGYWGIMARPVLAEYQRLTAYINRENTHFARFQGGEMYHDMRKVVARFLNVGADEVALTRGATEALQALIGGYNKLTPGDTVLYADLDYSEMKNAMRWLEARRGVKVAKVNFPEPTKDQPLTEADILGFYQRALEANPGTRLLLLTHLNNWTGLIIPVKKIAAMAKARGVDVILDAAHSVGQVDFDIKALGCDFVGVNLHKWVGTPIGCGVIYINKDRVTDIDTYMGKDPASEKVTARIDTGTANFAAHMAIPAAISFHASMGSAAKEARLRYLRNLWVEEARKLDKMMVLTPDDPAMVAGLTSFRLDGVTTTEGNNKLMRQLAEEYGVLTVRRTGPAAGDCIRVTPSFYNTPDDMMKLVRALKAIAA